MHRGSCDCMLLSAHLEDQTTLSIAVDFQETVRRFRETNTLQGEMTFVAQLESLGVDPDSLARLTEVLLKRAVIASSDGLADNADLRPEAVLKNLWRLGSTHSSNQKNCGKGKLHACDNMGLFGPAMKDPVIQSEVERML